MKKVIQICDQYMYIYIHTQDFTNKNEYICLMTIDSRFYYSLYSFSEIIKSIIIF